MSGTGIHPAPGLSEAPGALASAVVVGGGWSGIAAAWYLAGSGAAVTLLDENTGLGGRCATARLGERPVTLGGKNIGRRYVRFREFAAALGHDGFEPFGVNSSQIRGGRLRTVDSTSRLRSARTLLGAVSPRDVPKLLRLARTVPRGEADGFLGGPEFRRLAARLGDPPLSAFFAARTARHLLRPVTVRMNGAEPSEAYLGNLGANLRMLMDSFDQLSTGFEPLYEAVARCVTVRPGTRATALTTDASGRVDGVLAAAPGQPPAAYHADAVVLALPAPAAARLVAGTDDRLAAELREIRYFPVAVIVAEYDRPVFTDRVRAVVFDAASPLSNAGAYGVADRHIVRYTFSGQAARALLARDTGAEDLLDTAEPILAAHFPAAARHHRRRLAHARWEAGLCAYSRHHATRLDRVDAALTALLGLVLTGDWLRGASIEACFRAARERIAAAVR
jgi:oxygen-dependent protoporphyrinogen oxidase